MLFQIFKFSKINHGRMGVTMWGNMTASMYAVFDAIL